MAASKDLVRAGTVRAGSRITPQDAGSPRRRGLLLLFLGSIIVSFLAASAAPTPLYAVYAAHWRFSPLTTTVVFGVYALAVLATLLTFGRLSDHVGRRPVLLTGLLLQAVAVVLFTTAAGVGTLLAARVVQGLATGSSLGAVGAGMLDLDRRRGALANSFAPGVGTASGALISALAVQFLPAPTHLIYLVLLGVFGAQAAGVLAMRETAARRPGALRSLVPEIRLPKVTLSEIAIAAPVLFAVWALAGFYASLGPAVAATLLHSSSIVYGGLSLFVLAGVAAVSVLAFNRVEPRPTLYISIATLIAGVAVTLAATSTDSAAGFFIGTAIAGGGFGGGFQGGIRLVLPLVSEQDRAGVLSLLYIVSYLGLGVPAVIAGVLVTEVNSLLATAQEYGTAVVVLAVVALGGLLLHRPQEEAAGPAYAVAEAVAGCAVAGTGRSATQTEVAVALRKRCPLNCGFSHICAWNVVRITGVSSRPADVRGAMIWL